MNTKTTYFLAVFAALLLIPGIVGAEDDLAALAVKSRGATLRLDVKSDAGIMHSYGVFISEDGFALIDLGGLALKIKPEVVAADGTPLRMGTILGIFPEHGVALVKFKYRPRVWLQLAPKEPEIGEDVALVTLDGGDALDAKIPPVVGPVMAKRRGMMSNLRVDRFCRIFSLGFDPTPLQLNSIRAGMFAIDRNGDLVAVTNGTSAGTTQATQLLTPVFDLADRIRESAKGGKAIPFPLPAELNFTDTALMDSEYGLMDMASRRGDRDSAMRHLRSLSERFPESPNIKQRAATALVDPAGKAAGLAEFPKPDTKDLPAFKVSRFGARAAIRAKNGDMKGALEELEAAVAVSPPDFPEGRVQLATFYMYLGRVDEAERLFREAVPFVTENIDFLETFRRLLIRQGKSGEAEKLLGKIAELKKVYQWRRNAAAAIPPRPGNLPAKSKVPLIPSVPSPETPKKAPGTEEKVKLHTIAIPAFGGGLTKEDQRSLAEAIRKKLVDGADFAMTARAYSQDSKAGNGGAWGWVGRSYLNPTLAEAAFALPLKTVGPVIEDGEMFRILYVEARGIPSASAPPKPSVPSVPSLPSIPSVPKAPAVGPKSLEAMQRQVRSHHEAGRHGAAVKLREEILAIRRKTDGLEHPATLGAMVHLSNFYYDIGEKEKALMMREEIFEARGKMGDPEDPATLAAKGALATSYHDTGAKEKALKMREEVWAARNRSAGPEDPAVLAAKGDLATSYFAAGRKEEALKMREEVLKLRQKGSGAENLGTIAAMGDLAISYQDAGRKKEALEIREEVLALRRKVSTLGHPASRIARQAAMMAAIADLAISYDEAEKKTEADELRKELRSIEVELAKRISSKPSAKNYPFGLPVPGRPGMIRSPHDPDAGLIDARGLKPGTKIRCPFSSKVIRVPVFAAGAAAPEGEDVDRLKGLATDIDIQGVETSFDPETGIANASGDVKITLGKTVITAEEATYNMKSGEVVATGDAELVKEGEKFTGDRIKFNTETGEVKVEGEKPDAAARRHRGAGQAAGRRFEFKRARGRYQKLFALPVRENPSTDYLAMAALLSHIDPPEDYRRFAKKAVGRFEKSEKPADLERVGKIFFLLPADPKSEKALTGKALEMTRRCVSIPDIEKTPYYDWFAAARGMALYRTGNYDEAETWLSKALGEKSMVELRILAFAFRAMSRHQEERREDSQADLKEANRLYEELEFHPTKSQGGNWIDTLFARTALLEAWKLVEDKADALETLPDPPPSVPSLPVAPSLPKIPSLPPTADSDKLAEALRFTEQGEAKSRAGKFEDARKAHDRAVRLLVPLMQADLRNDVARFALARNYGELASVYREEDELDDAFKRADGAIQILEEMVGRIPGEWNYALWHAIYQSLQSEILSLQEKHEESIRLGEQAVESLRRLARSTAGPEERKEIGNGLAGALRSLGASHAAAGNKESAEEMQAKAVALGKELAKSRPEDPNVPRRFEAGGYKFGIPVPGRPGMIRSPHNPDAGLIDARGLKPGTKIRCPFTSKVIRVPDPDAVVADLPVPEPRKPEPAPRWQAGEEPVIKEISIRFVGGKNVDEGRIRRNLGSRVGARFSKFKIEEDIKNLYASGYVEFVRVLSEDVEGGVRLIYELQTRGVLGELAIVGASAISKEAVRREIGLKVGDRIAEAKLQIAKRNVEQLYRKRGYADVSANYEVRDMGRAGFSRVEFQIAEGGRSMIRKIEFEGNTVFGDRELHAKMQTEAKSANAPGLIDLETFDEDLIKIERLYQDKGYLNARIENVERIRVDKDHVELKIKISEGEVYGVAKASIVGNRAVKLGELEPLLQMKGGRQTYSTGLLEKDEKALQGSYWAKGYADARVRTSITSAGGNSLNVIYEITEGEVSYLGKVNIIGNAKTKDDVIRRELTVTPGELYNRVEIEASRRRLKDSGLFETVDFRSNPSSTPGFKDLDIRVEEKFVDEATAARKAIELDPDDAEAHVQLARALGGEGKIEEAIESCRKGLQLDPEMAEGHRVLGTALSYQGKLAEGLASVKKAAALDPESVEIQISLGAILMAMSKFDETAAAGRRAIELDPENASAHGLLGAALAGLGKYKEAAASLRQGVELDPDDAEIHSNLGAALSAQGKFDEAVAACERAIELDPDVLRANYILGRALARKGEFERAVVSLRRAVELQPDLSWAYDSLGGALFMLGKHDEALAAFKRVIELAPDSPRGYGKLGGALFELGKYEESIAASREAIELDPDHGLAHGNLGAALAGLGKWEEAIVSLRQAIKLNPDDAMPHSNLSAALARLERFEEAEVAVRRAIELAPKNAMAHGNLGAVLEKLGKFDEAIESLCRAIELDPDNVGFLGSLGEALYERGKFAEAAAAFRRVIQLDPQDAGAHSSLGGALSKVGESAEAVTAFRRATELEPGNTTALSNLGFGLFNTGKTDEALAAFRQAIKLDPKAASSQNNLGGALIKLGRFDEALAPCQRAVELDPDFAMAHTNLGAALTALGKHDEAVALCRRAIKLDPEDPMAYGNLGVTLTAMGKFDEALASCQRALDLDPANAGAHNGLGTVLFRTGKYEEAAASFERAIKHDPEVARANKLVGYAFLIAGRIGEARDPLEKAGVNPAIGSRLVRAEGLLARTLKNKGADDPSARLLAEEISSFVAKVIPPPEEAAVRKFWEDHSAEVAAALGTVTLRTIAIEKITGDPARPEAKQLALAKEIHSKLTGGEDFSALARKHSDDRRAKAGGLMAEVKQGVLPRALDGAAFSLGDGELSGVIEGTTSYHILKIESRQPGDADSFDDPKVKRVAQKLLVERRRAEWENEYLARLMEKVGTPGR